MNVPYSFGKQVILVDHGNIEKKNKKIDNNVNAQPGYDPKVRAAGDVRFIILQFCHVKH
jgi:hypothetical protein